LYEDNVSGKISDERFSLMSVNFETEQAELKRSIAKQAMAIKESNEQQLNVTSFLKVARKHLSFEEITKPLLNEMIEKILVHEVVKTGKSRSQKIEIHYNFGIGTIES